MSQHVTETPQILWKSINNFSGQTLKRKYVHAGNFVGNVQGEKRQYFGFMCKPWPQWDWSMQDLSSHKLLPIMPTNTCQLFLKHLHADDITTTNTANDHLYKLQFVSEILTGMFKNNSIPQTWLHIHNSKQARRGYLQLCAYNRCKLENWSYWSIWQQCNVLYALCCLMMVIIGHWWIRWVFLHCCMAIQASIFIRTTSTTVYCFESPLHKQCQGVWECVEIIYSGKTFAKLSSKSNQIEETVT